MEQIGFTDGAQRAVADSFAQDSCALEQPGRHRLDIRTAARVQLKGAGILSERIAHCPLCTVSEPELFHSWRRDQVKAVQWSGIVAQAPT